MTLASRMEEDAVSPFPPPEASAAALRLVEELGALGAELEAAARERRVPDLEALLERRQALLGELLVLVREAGVPLNQGALGEKWAEVMAQDARVEQSMLDSLTSMKRVLRQTRQKMQANATYFRPTRPAPCNFLDIKK